MELTKFQRKTLEGWRRMNPHGLTWPVAFRRLAFGWAILAALLAAMYFAFAPAAPFVACFLFGAMLRDIGYVRTARKVWPVSQAVIDWARVDDLLIRPPGNGVQTS